MIHLALFQPEIPHNTGALLRFCACMGVTLDIIEPCGFVLSDHHLKRAGMDYMDLTAKVVHTNMDAFFQIYQDRRIIAVDTNGAISYEKFVFFDGDVLLMGQESKGLPEDVLKRTASSIFIPMLPQRRSLNLALSSAIVTTEALRQLQCLPSFGKD